MEEKRASISEKHNTPLLILYISAGVVMFTLSRSTFFGNMLSSALMIGTAFSLLASVYTAVVRFVSNHIDSWAERAIVRPLRDTIFEATFAAYLLNKERPITDNEFDRFLEISVKIEELRAKLREKLQKKTERVS